MKTDTTIHYALILTFSFLFFNIHIGVAQDASNEAVYTIVENMPASKNCKHISDEKKKRDCTTEAIIHYISENINYPEDAKKAGIEGIVYIGFIVNNEGYVEEVEILRGIEGNPSINEEAVRVVKSLPQFIPGTQREREVNVRYNVPIKFAL